MHLDLSNRQQELKGQANRYAQRLIQLADDLLAFGSTVSYCGRVYGHITYCRGHPIFVPFDPAEIVSSDSLEHYTDWK
ncbi:MAG: hypothetical protein M5U01_20560 [Ardenticatenaceae bacterium]|nr:hypothetical protein [Ardenticatenaceae bacterium]HBY92877.1 hypothetical protein [Chloroflexota bacterium]